MGTLAYVEVLKRNGEVLARHAVTELPCYIGRGYDSDVLIDDPYIDTTHLEIEEIEPEGALVNDLESVNGTKHLSLGTPFVSGMVLPNDVLCLGRTRIRIRSCYDAVQETLPMHHSSLPDRLNSTTSAVQALLIFLLAVIAEIFETATQDAIKQIFYGVGTTSLGLVGVVIVSAVINRVFTGATHLAAHVTLVSLAFVVMCVGEAVVEYTFFAFDLPGTDIAKIVVTLGSLMGMLYFQMGFITRVTRRSRLMTVLMLSIGVAGWIWADRELDPDAYAKQNYNTVLKPGIFLAVPGIKPANFFGQTQELLKRKVDDKAGH
jgi:FHA domain